MNESRVALGKRIRNLRRKAGLTLAQLAEKAALSPKHLRELERGRGNPRLSSIESLAHSLGLSLSEMFDYEHEELPVDQIRAEMDQLLKMANNEQCRLAFRVLKSLCK